jgi:hypothetical protein
VLKIFFIACQRVLSDERAIIRWSGIISAKPCLIQKCFQVYKCSKVNSWSWWRAPCAACAAATVPYEKRWSHGNKGWHTRFLGWWSPPSMYTMKRLRTWQAGDEQTIEASFGDAR